MIRFSCHPAKSISDYAAWENNLTMEQTHNRSNRVFVCLGDDQYPGYEHTL